MGNSADTTKKLINGAILIISTVLKHVMSLAAEEKKRGSFYKCQIRSSPLNNIRRIRTSSAPHTVRNRQHHCHRLQKWHNKTKRHKSNGYAFLLDKRQSQTRAI
jgi:hypothetical protein